LTEEKKSLIEFPLLFPIKVMGAKVDGFVHALTVVAKNFDANFDTSTIELRDSSAGKYLGVTLHVWAVPHVIDSPDGESGSVKSNYDYLKHHPT
jgi:putative lipoic acid-binding regulatory protein